ncbi:SafA/ExsA family spore coat assembly protein [Lentibacillus lipolyticus]|nr:SafA/ExsA family spore coat assembly protein [Lentibacillus lipolyticus]
MKIHIVQKGDTLWEIAKQYDADFEQVKKMNPQLSSPDMIMPGMKIKIPSSTKPVKTQDITDKKQMHKQPAEKPYKDTSPKPMPAVEEDDVKQPKPVQPKMPMQPNMQMPVMEQEMNHYTTINLPQVPTYSAPEKEPEKESEKDKHMHYPSKSMPQMPPQSHHYQQMPQMPPQPHHYQQIPQMPPQPHHCQQMPQMPPQPHHYQQMPHPPADKAESYYGSKQDCGCGGGYQKPMHPQPMYNHYMQQPQPYHSMMASSSNMEMPAKPAKPYGIAYGSHQQNCPPGMLKDSLYKPKPQLTCSCSYPQDNFPYPMPPGYRENQDDTHEDENTSE